MKKKIKAKDLDKRFDQGEDVLEHFELENTIKRVNIDFPIGVLKDLDSLAKERGVTRQSLLKMWIFDRVKEEKAS
jgi:hypothetical protein